MIDGFKVTTKLFCALDFASETAANDLVAKVFPENKGFKIGLELFNTLGPAYVADLAARGADVFLDLKFYDIPNTVRGAVKAVAGLGVRYTNVHISGGEQMCRAAVEALANIPGERPKLLGVTLLTSMGQSELATLGVSESVADQVVRMAINAKAWGLDGVVCSAHELSLIQKACGSDFETMVPGIRPEGSALGDQNRVVTPQEAAELGATSIVVGRPISTAKDPRQAVRSILDALC